MTQGVSVTACQYGSLDDLTVAAEGSAKFSCHHCQMSLVGYRYIVRDDHPFCIRCYEALFANTCEECKSTIGTECKVLRNLCNVIGFKLFPNLLDPEIII